jgi:hypothetical protein
VRFPHRQPCRTIRNVPTGAGYLHEKPLNSAPGHGRPARDLQLSADQSRTKSVCFWVRLKSPSEVCARRLICDSSSPHCRPKRCLSSTEGVEREGQARRASPAPEAPARRVAQSLRQASAIVGHERSGASRPTVAVMDVLAVVGSHSKGVAGQSERRAGPPLRRPGCQMPKSRSFSPKRGQGHDNHLLQTAMRCFDCI